MNSRAAAGCLRFAGDRRGNQDRDVRLGAHPFHRRASSLQLLGAGDVAVNDDGKLACGEQHGLFAVAVDQNQILPREPFEIVESFLLSQILRVRLGHQILFPFERDLALSTWVAKDRRTILGALVFGHQRWCCR